MIHKVTVPNRLIRLNPDGWVLYSQRLSLTLSCHMILHRYPMDNQTCSIELGSYAYTTEDLLFHWTKTEAVLLNPENTLPEFHITEISYASCNKNYSTGNFPCLKANFHLKRRLKAYILSTYLPSFLVVLLSWLSFWIDSESTPARTSLSILTILTITTQSSSLTRSTPSNSFTKASDIWMATCLVFVFSAFIEYSIVNTLSRRGKRKRKKKSFIKKQTNSKGKEDDGEKEEEESKEDKKSVDLKQPNTKISLKRLLDFLKKRYHNEPVSFVEIVSRVLFPLLFLIFNFIYWPIYLF